MRDELIQEMMVGACADAIAKWNVTNNPLYVWDAIRWALSSEQPLPQECQDYLLWCVAGLDCLADARDPGEGRREPPAAKREDMPKIDATTAASRVAQVLGLVANGKNAFTEYAKDTQCEIAAYEALTGRSGLENVRRRRGLKSNRQVDRIVAKGRRLLRWTKPLP